MSSFFSGLNSQMLPSPFLEILPKMVLQESFVAIRQYLDSRLSPETVAKALDPSKKFPSPVAQNQNSYWLQQAKMIGINPRTLGHDGKTGTYLDVVKYALTFPETAIHLFPAFETGCANSLYAPINWSWSEEFMDPEWIAMGLTTPEQQLRVMVNLLHALGKTVGMDVMPHMDRFAEDVFLYPGLFEWVQLNPARERILPHEPHLTQRIQECIQGWLRENQTIGQSVQVFDPSVPESLRREALFGPQYSPGVRLNRRIALMRHLRQNGFETLPVANTLPYRPLKLVKIHNEGQADEWTEFDLARYPSSLSKTKLFGSITPYRWFEWDMREGKLGALDTLKPNKAAWVHFAERVAACQREMGFDFLRADMGHIQMHKPELSLDSVQSLYGDAGLPNGIWAFVKAEVQKQAPYFATFGECPLTVDHRGYGNPYQNALAQRFDVAMGFLQYFTPAHSLLKHTQAENLKPLGYPGLVVSNTVITADTDCPKYKETYQDPLSKVIRVFLGLFQNQTSYMNGGYELRDSEPKTEDAFAKRFIDHVDPENPPQYQWGEDISGWLTITQMRQVYARLQEQLRQLEHYWLDSSRRVGAWLFYERLSKLPRWLFVLNTSDSALPVVSVENPFQAVKTANQQASQSVMPPSKACFLPVFTTHQALWRNLESVKLPEDGPLKLKNILPGEGLIYQFADSAESQSESQ